MKRTLISYLIFPAFIGSFCTGPGVALAQNMQQPVASFEDYINELVQSDDDYLVWAEDWREVIDGLIENPVGINSTDIDLLYDLRLISRLQLNKLREYRLIYGDLLTLYELKMIEGWDDQTVRRVLPLVAVLNTAGYNYTHTFRIRYVRQRIILKTSFITQKRKGYETITDDHGNPTGPAYLGSPLKLSLRYDLELGKKILLGLRMEKDPGEPYLLKSDFPVKGMKMPDHCSGHLQIKKIGPLNQVILGDFQVHFGYGLNLSGGQYGSFSRNGPVTMAHRIKPQTSISETGFFRGLAISASLNRFNFYAFSSWQKLDGTSVQREPESGNILSFSTVNTSGLHRTQSEIDRRKEISERLLGGMAVFSNNWLKTGLILFHHQYSVDVATNPKPYARFGFSGRSNLVGGWASTLFLPRVQVFFEGSLGQNKGWAVVGGLKAPLSPGININLVGRNFSLDYQNWHGMGFVSAGRNSNERGFQASLHVGLPERWDVSILTDYSASPWFRYNLNFPTRQFLALGSVTKTWKQGSSLIFSARVQRLTMKEPLEFSYISRSAESAQFKIRMEGRVTVIQGISMKTRLEANLSNFEEQGHDPAWLFFQDLSYASANHRIKVWLRVCFFQADGYDNRIYAYENDVLYDFTSFMHYGKGNRGIVMFTWGPLRWLDIWLRLSTVQYADRNIGSGWDEIKGRRMNEIEIQLRIRDPG